MNEKFESVSTRWNLGKEDTDGIDGIEGDTSGTEDATDDTVGSSEPLILPFEATLLDISIASSTEIAIHFKHFTGKLNHLGLVWIGYTTEGERQSTEDEVGSADVFSLRKQQWEHVIRIGEWDECQCASAPERRIRVFKFSFTVCPNWQNNVSKRVAERAIFLLFLIVSMVTGASSG